MGKVLIEEQNLINIADSIREKTGSTNTMLPSEMSGNINNIEDAHNYFNTTYSGTSPDFWANQNLIKKVPDIIIDNTVTSISGLFETCFNSVIPKIICNSNVTDMSSLYRDCIYANNIDLSGLNTSNVTNAREMFYNNQSLTSLDLSNFNTSKITDIYCIFYNDKKLTNLNLSNFITNNVTNMGNMFYNCSKLTSLDLSNFNTSKVTDMNSMFYNCSSLTSLDISNFDTRKVTNMRNMFYNCSSLTSLNVSNFNTVYVENMEYMFKNCSSLTSLDLSNFSFSMITSNGSNYTARGMFDGCTNLTNLTFGNNYGYNFKGSQNSVFSTLNLSSCTLLTHDSLMDVINKLYDLTSSGKKSQQLVLGADNIAKLTEEEIAIATNKGWTVS